MRTSRTSPASGAIRHPPPIVDDRPAPYTRAYQDARIGQCTAPFPLLPPFLAGGLSGRRHRLVPWLQKGGLGSLIRIRTMFAPPASVEASCQERDIFDSTIRHLAPFTVHLRPLQKRPDLPVTWTAWTAWTDVHTAAADQHHSLVLVDPSGKDHSAIEFAVDASRSLLHGRRRSWDSKEYRETAAGDHIALPVLLFQLIVQRARLAKLSGILVDAAAGPEQTALRRLGFYALACPSASSPADPRQLPSFYVKPVNTFNTISGLVDYEAMVRDPDYAAIMDTYQVTYAVSCQYWPKFSTNMHSPATEVDFQLRLSTIPQPDDQGKRPHLPLIMMACVQSITRSGTKREGMGPVEVYVWHQDAKARELQREMLRKAVCAAAKHV
jgi:hypothetical protein